MNKNGYLEGLGMTSLLSYLKAVLTFDIETVHQLRNDTQMTAYSMILLGISGLVHAIMIAFSNNYDYFVPYMMLNPRLSTFSFSYPQTFSIALFILTFSFDMSIIIGTVIIGGMLVSLLSSQSFIDVLRKTVIPMGFISSIMIVGTFLTVLAFISGYYPPILARVFQIGMLGIIVVYLHALIITTDYKLAPWRILPILWLYLVITIVMFGMMPLYSTFPDMTTTLA